MEESRTLKNMLANLFVDVKKNRSTKTSHDTRRGGISGRAEALVKPESRNPRTFYTACTPTATEATATTTATTTTTRGLLLLLRARMVVKQS